MQPPSSPAAGGVFLRAPLPAAFLEADEEGRRAMVEVGAVAWGVVAPRVAAALALAEPEEDAAAAAARVRAAVAREAADLVAREWQPRVAAAEAARSVAEERRLGVEALAAARAQSVAEEAAAQARAAAEGAAATARLRLEADAATLRTELAGERARADALERRLAGLEEAAEERARKAAAEAASRAALQAREAVADALHAALRRADVADGVLGESKARCAAAEERLREVEARLEAARTEAASQQRRAASSTLRGHDGEVEVARVLADAVLPGLEHATLDVVGKEAHRGDFQLECGAAGATGGRVRLLIDAKSYTRAVSAAERAKLRADVDRDPAVAGGLLVSLRSRVAAVDHFAVEHTEAGKPLLYVVLEDMTTGECGAALLQACRVLRGLAVVAQHHRDDDGRLPRDVLAGRVKKLLDATRKQRRLATEQGALAAETAADLEDLLAAVMPAASRGEAPPAAATDTPSELVFLRDAGNGVPVGEWVKGKDLFARYTAYCEAHSLACTSNAHFNRRVRLYTKDLGLVEEKQMQGGVGWLLTRGAAAPATA